MQTMKDLKQRLKKKSKEWLVDRLFELSLADNANADRIVLSLAAEDDGTTECVTKFRSQLDKAVEQIAKQDFSYFLATCQYVRYVL